MRSRRDTAFTVELLGLFILLIAVITVISSVFVMSRAHSLQAKQLTEAVILAESTAETASAEPGNDGLLDAVSGMNNTVGHRALMKESGKKDSTVIFAVASIDGNDDPSGKGRYLIRITRTYPDGTNEDRADKGSYAKDVIDVFEPGTIDPEELSNDADLSRLGEPLYTLSAGTYFGPDDHKGEGGK